MRYVLVLALVLAGCTLGGGKLAKPADAPNPITGDPIAVTSLDKPAGPAGPAAKPATKPAAEGAAPDISKPLAEKPVADPAPTVPPVVEEPARVPGPEELACLKTGGQWAVAGKAGGMTCVRTLRDAGKSCRKKSDCEGDCLARSNTCSPISPLFGCNDILQDNGVMVTLCID